ncbi:hypothetical protein Mapa_003207 [Marchantia paleacea]|nr:hypothetical protein Mapa_003207 [Marchantia paleacea]
MPFMTKFRRYCDRNLSHIKPCHHQLIRVGGDIQINIDSFYSWDTPVQLFENS